MTGPAPGSGLSASAAEATALPRAELSTLGRIGFAMLAAFVVVALAAPLIAPHHPTERVGAPFSRPDAAHPLGTNDVGQDILSELIWAARVSLFFGFFGAVAATGLGVLVGISSGFLGGRFDAAAMRLVDLVLVMPFLPLLLVLAAFFGGGVVTEIIVISVVMWAPTAREIRSQTLSLRESGHVQASLAMGATSLWVLRRHLLPGVAALIPPQLIRAAKGAILLEASLSFLGLGDPTVRSWGTMLYYANARGAFLTDAWLWWVLPPGLCIGLFVLGFALAGLSLEGWGRPAALRGAAGSVTRARPGSTRTPAVDAAPRTGSHETPAVDATASLDAAATAGSLEEPVVEAARDVDSGGTVVGTPVREAGDAPAPPAVATSPVALLSVRGLQVAYGHERASVVALRGVDFDVGDAEIIGVIGESGSGKSTLVNAVLGLVRPAGEIRRGSIRLRGEELTRAAPARMRALRGAAMTLVPQSGLNSLNPVMRVRDQVVEIIVAKRPHDAAAAPARATALLEAVGIPAARQRAFPHQFSGGMRQRVLIAMALATEPPLILADEPTTGLDGMVKLEVLDLLVDAARRHGASVLLVSHDLPAVFRVAERVLVMRRGEVVERGDRDRIAHAPRHPYTRALLEATPSAPASAPAPEAGSAEEPAAAPVLRVTELSKRFVARHSDVLALDRVDLHVASREIVGVVGRSGAGKSTLARLIFGLEAPDHGTIEVGRRDRGATGNGAGARLRQLVMQDPYAALPPHFDVAAIVGEPLHIYGDPAAAIDEAVVRALADSGLRTPERFLHRHPHELSGGERQRVALARALAPDPALIVADEPASLLDAPLRAEVVALLARLRRERGTAVLYITHDLGLAASICDRLVVIAAGRAVESGATQELLTRPTHPATEELVTAWRELSLPGRPAV